MRECLAGVKATNNPTKPKMAKKAKEEEKGPKKGQICFNGSGQFLSILCVFNPSPGNYLLILWLIYWGWGPYQ